MTARRPSFPARIHPETPAGTAARPNAVRPRTLVQPAAHTGSRTTLPQPAAMQSQGVGLDSAAVRQRMVQRLAAQGLDDARVLQAMGTVERHRFVDSGLVAQAYEDTSLPIGLGQTISKPSVVGRMLQLLLASELAQNGPKDQPLGRVLEIGTGCGYQAAVLSHVVQEVYSIERLRGLHDKARDNLRPFRLRNLHLLLGDGMQGYAAGAPYAGIVAAAGGQQLPAAWGEQLAMGGRLVAPVVMATGQQALVVLDKTSQGLRQTVYEDVHFVPLKSGIA